MDDGSGFLALGAIFLIIGFVGLVLLAIWVWALVDAFKRSDAEFAAVGQNKVVWLVVLAGAFVIGLPFIGALVYLIWPRNQMKKAATLPPAPTGGYGY